MPYLVVIVPPENVNGDSRVNDIATAVAKACADYGIAVQVEVVK